MTEAKRPWKSEWSLYSKDRSGAHVWFSRRHRLMVISDVLTDPRRGDEYHVSVSTIAKNERAPRPLPTDADVELVRRTFKMGDATERNDHAPEVDTIARHLWLPVVTQ